jgi:tetratricopeptide (TPR) repeat protein
LFGYLGDRYQDTGRFDDSIDCFRKSINLVRSYSTAHLQNFDLLLLFTQLRRWKDAQEVAPALLKEAEIRVLLEEAPHLYRAAARTYLSTNKFSDAESVIKLIPKIGNDPRELERAVYTVELEDATGKRATDNKLLALEKQILQQDGSINKVEMLVSLSRTYRRHNDSKQSARLSFAAGDALFLNDMGPPPERVRAGIFALAIFEEALLYAGEQQRPAIEKKIASLKKQVQLLFQKANDRTGITIPSF